MNKRRMLVVMVAMLALLGLSVGTSTAQSQGQVIAEVDRAVVTTDETIILTVTVDAAGGSASQPSLPALDGFRVLGTSSGQQITIINGDMRMQQSYQYQLQPLQPGQFEIGPIVVNVNGVAQMTAPITIQVSQGTGVPQPSNPSGPSSLLQLLPQLLNQPSLGGLGNLPGLPATGSGPSGQTIQIEPAPAPAALAGQDFYLEAQIDNQTPYQGQQMLFTLRFYQAVRTLGQSEYQLPDFTGFWSEQVPEQGEYMVDVAGRTYQVTELWTVLFPTGVGEVSIDPAIMAVPGDFLSRGVTLTSEPIALTVRPLPDNAPAGFQGAVGRFDITAEVDQAQTQVNDTVTWRIILAGEGNLESLPDPIWPDSPGWRAFDSQASTEMAVSEGRVSGRRTYERVLVPTEAGNLTLPPVKYIYFDPELAEYVTLTTEPIAISVAAEANNPAAPVTVPAAGNGVASPVPLNPVEDIRPSKAAPASWTSARAPLVRQPLFWVLWTVPLLLLAGQFGWQRRQMNRQNNVALHRSQQAAGKARQALKQAAKDPGIAKSAAGQILTTYLVEKLDRPLVGATQSQLTELLIANGVSPDLASDVQDLLMASEMGRYAPGSTKPADDDLVAATHKLIGKLEKALN